MTFQLDLAEGAEADTVHPLRQSMDENGFQGQAGGPVLPQRGTPRPFFGDGGHVDTRPLLFGHRRGVLTPGGLDPLGNPDSLAHPHRLVDQSVIVVIIQPGRAFPVSIESGCEADPRTGVCARRRALERAEGDLLEGRQHRFFHQFRDVGGADRAMAPAAVACTVDVEVGANHLRASVAQSAEADLGTEKVKSNPATARRVPPSVSSASMCATDIVAAIEQAAIQALCETRFLVGP